jgi:anti-sigma B factor antagonist
VSRDRELTIDRRVEADGSVTLVCRGPITQETSGLFKSEIKSLAPDYKFVRANMSDVDFVDSAGLGDVLTAYLSARSAGCDLKLVNVNPRVKDLLDISSLTSVLEEDPAR